MVHCRAGVPLGSLAGDSALHLWLDQGNTRALGIGALMVTLISAMFHWHVMQNGAMLVGENSRSLVDDLKQIPRLIATFVWNPIRWVLSSLRPAKLPEVATREPEAEIAA